MARAVRYLAIFGTFLGVTVGGSVWCATFLGDIVATEPTVYAMDATTWQGAAIVGLVAGLVAATLFTLVLWLASGRSDASAPTNQTKD